MAPIETPTQAALSYSRHLFANVVDWYKNADTKAQVLLTLDGAFLSFVAGSAFRKSDDLQNILDSFETETWAFAIGMALTLLGSIYSALACIRSRLADPSEITEHLHQITGDKELELRQSAETMWFFGHIAQLTDRKRFQQRIKEFSESDEITAVSSQIFLLSRNVLRKHQCVNRGFLLAGATLLLFLAMAASYLMRVNLGLSDAG